MGKKANLYIAGIVVAGFLVSAYCIAGFFRGVAADLRPESLQYVFIMFLLGILCRALPIYLSDDRALDISFVANLATLLMSGPEMAVALMVLGTPFVVEPGRSKGDPIRHIFNVSPAKTLFNISNQALSIYVAGEVYLLLGGVPGRYEYPYILLPTLAFSFVCIFLNAAILIRLFTIGGQGEFVPILVQTLRLVLPNMVLVAPLGLLLASLLQLQNGAYVAMLFLTPLLLSRYTFKLYLNSKQEFYRMVQTMVAVIEAKDKYTEGHSKRVSAYAEKIAAAMGLSSSKVSEVRTAALLHDVGKVGVKDEILNKPGGLNEEEWKSIREHPAKAMSILSQVELPGGAKEMILHHHERYDGRGYPDGAGPDTVSLGAYILEAADAYDAMTSDRSYRKGMKKEVAMRILEEERGKQFHPDVVDAFLKLLQENREVDG